MMERKPPARQKGVALITALFIFSLVTIAAVAMAERQTLDIRRTENLIHYDQAYMYALGAEKWAGQLLLRDEDMKVDSLNDPWMAQDLVAIPVEGGSIGGAEDTDYLSGDLPYRTANQPMVSISELRSLKNVIAEEYNCFVGDAENPPLVNTIKADDVTINVNTAPAAVLQSIDNRIDDSVLQKVLEGRKDEPYKDVATFVKTLKDQLFVGNDPKQKQEMEQFDKQMEQMKLSVGSKYYEVTSNAQIGRMQVKVISLLKRENNKITTIQRTIGTY
jgi:type II secretory pathway component PulK